MIANKAATLFTCQELAQKGATDMSAASQYIHVGKGNAKLTIKDWHRSYTLFNNWTYLNAIMALSSSFEAYLTAIITMAIDSDPGMIINAPKSVDGIAQLKFGEEFKKELVESKIIDCTKGEWSARTSAIKSLFGHIPAVLSDSIADLDKLRALRNKVGHAFGRDIDRAKDYMPFRIDPMVKLDWTRFRKYQSLILRCSSQLDIQLQNEHIGLFHYLRFYHDHYTEIEKFPVEIDRHVHYKYLIGQVSKCAIPKSLAQFVVNYYESLKSK